MTDVVHFLQPTFHKTCLSHISNRQCIRTTARMANIPNVTECVNGLADSSKEAFCYNVVLVFVIRHKHATLGTSHAFDAIIAIGRIEIRR